MIWDKAEVYYIYTYMYIYYNVKLLHYILYPSMYIYIYGKLNNNTSPAKAVEKHPDGWLMRWFYGIGFTT